MKDMLYVDDEREGRLKYVLNVSEDWRVECLIGMYLGICLFRCGLVELNTDI